jgi:O-methyltransferase
MSVRTIGLDDRLHAYLLAVGVRESPVLQRLRQETAGLPMARMQISPEQGEFMAQLVRLTGARHCLEVGTFTGYSTLAVAEALPAEGRILAMDVSLEWTAMATRYWAEAGVAHRIELRIGPAATTLEALLAADTAGHWDFMFIDADKTSYCEYFRLGMALLRPGGLMAFDNTLWGGRVADPAIMDEDTVALRTLNAQLHDDPRIDVSLVPIGDGLTLVRKRVPEN